MSRVFLSYRRDDTEGQARALAQVLTARLGRDGVFMDVDGIALGRDFRQVVAERLSSCDVFLALIGPRWLDASDSAGRRRLDDPADFVRQEIAAALTRDIPVTPVLVQGAQMPPADRLPADIKPLVFRNGMSIGHEKWDSDVNELLSRLKLAPVAPSAPPMPTPSRSRAGVGAIAAVALVAMALVAYVVWSPRWNVTQETSSTAVPNDAGSVTVDPKVPPERPAPTTVRPNKPEPEPPTRKDTPAGENDTPTTGRGSPAPAPQRPDIRGIGLDLIARWQRARADHDREKIFEVVGEPYWAGESLMLNRAQLWERLEGFAARGRAAQARAGASAPPPPRRETLAVRVLPAKELREEFRQTDFRDQLFGEGLKTVGLTLDSEIIELTERTVAGANVFEFKTLYLIRVKGDRAELVGDLGDCGRCGLSRVTP